MIPVFLVDFIGILPQTTHDDDFMQICEYCRDFRDLVAFKAQVMTLL